MRNTLLAFAVLLLLSSSAYSQNPLTVGNSQLNVGIGLSDWGVPVYLGFDHGVHQDITIGAEFSFRSYRENFGNNRFDHSIIGLSGNANYHFNTLLEIPRTWDFYAGLNIGFYAWSSPNDYDGNRTSGLGLGAQIGGRYYLSNKLGLNLELGGGNAFSGGKFGLTIKL